MSYGRVAMGVCLALAFEAAPACANADVGAAAAQFEFGVGEMLAGRFASGCPALQASFASEPRAGTLFTLAECELGWGHKASALARYEEYLALYERMSAEQGAKWASRARIAASERASLQAQLPRLTIRLPDAAPPGVVVSRDNVVLGGPMLGAAAAVDQGTHTIRVQTSDGQTAEQLVTLDEGESRVVVAQLPTPPVPQRQQPASPPTPAASSSRPDSTHRAWTLTTLGVAVAGLAATAVVGGVALAKKGSAADCTSQGVCPTLTAADAGNAARGWANAGTATTIVTGLALAATVVLWLTERSHRAGTGSQQAVSWFSGGAIHPSAAGPFVSW